MDTTITLNQISLPLSAKVQIYKNGDDTHKIICKNVKLTANETTTVIGILTIHRVCGITTLNNFDEVEWKDIVALNDKIYCLPNEESNIYDVTINSSMN